MDAARPPAPRRDIAASRRPAGQPSVRSCSSETSSRPRSGRATRRGAPRPRPPNSELIRADLDHLAGRAQPRKAERRVDARRDHDLQVARRVLHQLADRRVHEFVAQLVIVVEHEHDRLGQRRELVDQPRQHGAFSAGPAFGSAASTPPPNPGTTVRSAATT